MYGLYEWKSGALGKTGRDLFRVGFLNSGWRKQ